MTAPTEEDVNKIITDFALEDLPHALNIITANFVGLAEAYVKLSDEAEQGAEKKTITIDGGYRDITISEPN